MQIEKSFGVVLKRLREQKGISQETLAEQADVHRTYISLLERGIKAPTLGTLFRLANALGLEASRFVKQVEEHRSKFTGQAAKVRER